MVSTAALIAALQGQFSGARQAQGRGANSSLPGLLGAGNGEGNSGVNALASGGISAGGVPSTATTGASIASGIGGAAESLDPVTQQVIQSLNQREPGERGDLGAGVTGGDVNTLLSVLGGPLAIPTILGTLVASQELGLPPSTSINSLLNAEAPGGLSFGGTGINFGNNPLTNPLGGINFGGRDSVGGSGGNLGGLSFGGGDSGVNFRNDPLTNPAGGVSF